ncbi:MAG: metal-dependent hydrolase [Epsilonproteobacteria bacterium]|nr:metal-dependent hydrolase [Campylobacterota bacterium]
MLTSKVNWLDILLWKLKAKRIQHTSDLFVIYPKSLPLGDFILWLGHASFYLRIKGVGILLDPVFGDIPLHKRLIPLPLDPQSLQVDLILISHGHYDHLDLASLALFNVPIVTPTGLGRYIPHRRTIELGWWEEVEVEGVRIRALPAKHWHQRSLFDRNRALWCSFSIEELFFCGDSAYSNHFRDIGKKCRIDTALLPIGAYEPRHIMAENHMDPQQAYQAFLDLRAKRFIPYHYGTFILSDEPVEEPLRWIEELAIEDGRIQILQPGEWSLLEIAP